jgi:hypothetical protein
MFRLRHGIRTVKEEPHHLFESFLIHVHGAMNAIGSKVKRQLVQPRSGERNTCRPNVPSLKDSRI